MVVGHVVKHFMIVQGIQQCRRKPESSQAYLYNGLACMAAQLGRVGEARAWFEEGTSTAEGAASVALWQVRIRIVTMLSVQRSQRCKNGWGHC